MIRFACPGCSATMTVADDKAGQQRNCPKCKTTFIIPGEPPPKAPPLARRSTRRDEEDDDVPVRRSRRRDDDDEDDRPRSRQRSEEEDDDRPRRRRQEYDDDDDRPRKKKKTTSGMILACGIVVLVMGLAGGGLAINDLSVIEKGLNAIAGAGLSRNVRDRMPPEVKSMISQFETAFLLYQIACYVGIGMALLDLVGGVGLILHQVWGRVVVLIGMGLGALSMLLLLGYFVMLATITTPAGAPGPPLPWGAMVLRGLVLVIPIVMGAITLFNTTHTRLLRTKL